ncbi:hypothetical protein L9G16_04730 [Shewanella sp. A25]|nr:hypothetical protein [Shewanella shenzhenensis]
MNTGTLALLIPILAIVGGYVVAIMKIREKQASSNSAQAAENQVLHAQIDALRQRVEILEQLVTDDSFQLKRDINKA